EAGAGAPCKARQPARLSAVADRLIVEESLKRGLIGSLIGVEVDQFIGSFARVAIEKGAGAATHDTEGRLLRERDAIVQAFRRSAALESARMERPDLLDFGANVGGIRDQLLVRAAARGPWPDLVARHASREGTTRAVTIGSRRTAAASYVAVAS